MVRVPPDLPPILPREPEPDEYDYNYDSEAGNDLEVKNVEEAEDEDPMACRVH